MCYTGLMGSAAATAAAQALQQQAPAAQAGLDTFADEDPFSWLDALEAEDAAALGLEAQAGPGPSAGSADSAESSQIKAEGEQGSVLLRPAGARRPRARARAPLSSRVFLRGLFAAHDLSPPAGPRPPPSA